jgi:hypothetical protein
MFSVKTINLLLGMGLRIQKLLLAVNGNLQDMFFQKNQYPLNVEPEIP